MEADEDPIPIPIMPYQLLYGKGLKDKVVQFAGYVIEIKTCRDQARHMYVARWQNCLDRMEML